MVEYLNNQRFILSVIVSFLNEDDGTCFLITNKSWTKSILPLFQLPTDRLYLISNNTNTTSSTSSSSLLQSSPLHIKKKRHLFKVIPVQDSQTLCDRLNTKRLAKRINLFVNYQNKRQFYQSISKKNMNQIAWDEWQISRIHASIISLQSNNNSINIYNDNNNNSNDELDDDSNNWQTSLELLRFRTPPKGSLTYANILQNNKLLIQSTTIGTSPLPPPPPTLLPGITLIASYPRSGNTLLRTLIERVTNMVTGSDTRPDRTLSKSLATQHNLVGEGIITSVQTPIVKTHYPERKGYRTFQASRVIVLVRNPYDAIDSYWNMCCTNTHTESITDDIYDLYCDKFVSLARHEICIWIDFLRFWMKQDRHAKGDRVCCTHGNDDNDDDGSGNASSVLPSSILLVRYEDLILHTFETMKRVLKFMLSTSTTTSASSTRTSSSDHHHYFQHELHPFWEWRLRKGLGLTDSNIHNFVTKHNNNSHAADEEETKQTIETSHLGSYKPRIQQDASQNNDGHDDMEQVESDGKKAHDLAMLARIGKSLKRNRYSNDTLDHFHNVANEKENQLHLESTTSSSSSSSSGDTINLLEYFGYSIQKDNFPLNFIGSTQDCNTNTFMRFENLSFDLDTNIVVNGGSEIRRQNDAYGRAMTSWRRGETYDDRLPFPTVQRSATER